jgi:plastocyanin
MMKIIKYLFFSVTFMLCSTLFMNSYATIWTVNVQNFSFNPNSLPDVRVGDTVRWVWVSGSHTTTSTTIPAGADAWDHAINSGNTEFDYIPVVTGTYNYKCTPHASMGMTGSFIVSPPVGIAVSEQEPEFTVSPNPFRDKIMIRFADNSGIILNKVEITNITGKVCSVTNGQLNELSESVTLNLGDLIPGFYFVRISDGTGKIYTRKILKD